jgi:choline kinase
MQAVVLAAGLGSRLGALTDRLPKALIPIVGEPLLVHAVRFAQAAGARGIVVVGGFGFDLLAREVARRELPVTLIENGDFHDGNLVSLMTARARIVDEFLLMNVDHLYRGSIAVLAGADVADVTAFIDTDRQLHADDMKVARDGRGRLRQIDKTLTAFDAGYVGITKVPAGAADRYWAAAETAQATLGRAIHVERVLARLADEGHPPLCRDVSGHGWLEIDVAEERERAEAVLGRGDW